MKDNNLDNLLKKNDYHMILDYLNDHPNLDTNCYDAFNNSWLSHSIFYYPHNYNAIKALLDSKFNFLYAGSDYKNPLIMAAQENSYIGLKLILKKDKSILHYISPDRQWNTLFYACCYTDNKRIIIALLRAGIDSKLIDNNNDYASNIAQRNGFNHSANIINFYDKHKLSKKLNNQLPYNEQENQILKI